MLPGHVYTERGDILFWFEVAVTKRVVLLLCAGLVFACGEPFEHLLFVVILVLCVCVRACVCTLLLLSIPCI